MELRLDLGAVLFLPLFRLESPRVTHLGSHTFHKCRIRCVITLLLFWSPALCKEMKKTLRTSYPLALPPAGYRYLS